MKTLTAPKKKKKFKFDVSFEDLVRRDVQRTEDKRRLRLQQRVQKKPKRNYWVEHLDNVLAQKLGAA